MSLLPKEPTTKSSKLEEYSMLLYGPPKIGKSTFASKFIVKIKGVVKHPLFIATEPGLRHLSVYKTQIEKWVQFKKVVMELEKRIKKRDFGTKVIDTVDILFKQCVRYICDKHNFRHPSDESWGKGYELILDEFAKWVLRLVYLPGGTIFISHSQAREIKSRVQQITRISPTITGSCRKVIIPLVDIIAYCGFDTGEDDGEETTKRVIIMEPTETIEAGDRTGRLPKKLPLRYKTFRRYFDGAIRLDKKKE